MAYLPARDAVLEDLPEMSEFRPAILDAWKRWRDLGPNVLIDMNESARAIVVHCFIVAEMAKRLDGIATVHDKSALKIFAIRNYAIRFKKHDNELISRNQETDQVKAFMGQLPLDGVPTMHNLEGGYVLDTLGTDVVSTNLVCPNGYKNSPHWHIELHDGGYELSDVADLFPDKPTPKGSDDSKEHGSRWKKRESGVVIPFNRNKKPK